jgi:hypothetical protein
MSIALRIQLNDTTTNQFIVQYGTGSAHGWYCTLFASSAYRFAYNNGSTMRSDLTNTSAPLTGSWQTFICDIAPGGMDGLWRNGTLVANASGMNQAFADPTYTLNVGGRGAGTLLFGGNFTNLTIWNRTLNTAEKAQVFANNFSVACSNQVAFYDFRNDTSYRCDGYGRSNTTAADATIDFSTTIANTNDAKPEWYAHGGQFPYGALCSHGNVASDVGYYFNTTLGAGKKGLRLATYPQNYYPAFANTTTWYGGQNVSCAAAAVQAQLTTGGSVTLTFHNMPSSLTESNLTYCSAGSTTCGANNWTKWADDVVFDYIQMIIPNSTWSAYYTNVSIEVWNEPNLPTFSGNNCARNSSCLTARVSRMIQATKALDVQRDLRAPAIKIIGPGIVCYDASSLSGAAANETMQFINQYFAGLTNSEVDGLSCHPYTDAWEIGGGGEPSDYYASQINKWSQIQYACSTSGGATNACTKRYATEYGLQDPALNNYSQGAPKYYANRMFQQMGMLQVGNITGASYTEYEQANCGPGYPEHPDCWNDRTQGAALGYKNLTPHNVTKDLWTYCYDDNTTSVYAVSFGSETQGVRGILTNSTSKGLRLCLASNNAGATTVNVALSGFSNLTNAVNQRNGSSTAFSGTDLFLSLSSYETVFLNITQPAAEPAAPEPSVTASITLSFGSFLKYNPAYWRGVNTHNRFIGAPTYIDTNGDGTYDVLSNTSYHWSMWNSANMYGALTRGDAYLQSITQGIKNRYLLTDGTCEVNPFIGGGSVVAQWSYTSPLSSIGTACPTSDNDGIIVDATANPTSGAGIQQSINALVLNASRSYSLNSSGTTTLGTARVFIEDENGTVVCTTVLNTAVTCTGITGNAVVKLAVDANSNATYREVSLIDQTTGRQAIYFSTATFVTFANSAATKNLTAECAAGKCASLISLNHMPLQTGNITSPSCASDSKGCPLYRESDYTDLLIDFAIFVTDNGRNIDGVLALEDGNEADSATYFMDDVSDRSNVTIPREYFRIQNATHKAVAAINTLYGSDIIYMCSGLVSITSTAGAAMANACLGNLSGAQLSSHRYPTTTSVLGAAADSINSTFTDAQNLYSTYGLSGTPYWLNEFNEQNATASCDMSPPPAFLKTAVELVYLSALKYPAQIYPALYQWSDWVPVESSAASGYPRCRAIIQDPSISVRVSPGYDAMADIGTYFRDGSVYIATTNTSSARAAAGQLYNGTRTFMITNTDQYAMNMTVTVGTLNATQAVLDNGSVRTVTAGVFTIPLVPTNTSVYGFLIIASDGAAPTVLSNTSNTTNTTARLNTTLSENGNVSINFGTTLALGTRVTSNDFKVNHSINMSGLNPGTLYYFNRTVCDAQGSCATAASTFTTYLAPNNIAFSSTTPGASPSITNASSQAFSYTLNNPSNLSVNTTWRLNGTTVATTPGYTFVGNATNVGTWRVNVTVASSSNTISYQWLLTVSAFTPAPEDQCPANFSNVRTMYILIIIVAISSVLFFVDFKNPIVLIGAILALSVLVLIIGGAAMAVSC